MLQFLTISCLGLHLSMAVLVGLGEFPSDLERWVETSPPECGSERWFAANQDVEHEWVVALRNDRPRAQLRDGKAEDLTPLPFHVEPGSSREGLAGRRLAIKVSDGWIVGFNAGEFGAGLWWFSPDGKDRYRISAAWVKDFIPTEAGLLALEGLAHGNVSRGRIIRLTRTSGGRWRSEDFLNLKHAPEVYAKAADGSLVIATTDRLLRVVPAGKKVEVLLDGVFWGGLCPNSMIITPAGLIYVGMRHGVAKVERKGGSCRLLWLLPDKGFDELKPEEGFK